jgi:hypothetical protein
LGIRDPHGQALPRGTVSSAIYRARMKREARVRNRSSPARPHQFDSASSDNAAQSPPQLPAAQRARAGPLPPAMPPMPNNASSLATAAAFIHRMRDQYDD